MIPIENYGFEGDDNDGSDDNDDDSHCQVCDKCSIYGEQEEGWEDAVAVDANPDYEYCQY